MCPLPTHGPEHICTGPDPSSRGLGNDMTIQKQSISDMIEQIIDDDNDDDDDDDEFIHDNDDISF